MTEYPSSCVVDASVVIKLFVPEADADKARVLLAGLSSQPLHAFHVPDLFYVECANILWKGISRYHYSLAKVKKDLSDLQALALQATPTFDLVEAALDIAHSHNISAYDACYVALASRLNVPLITADQKLVAALASISLPVTLLRDFQVSAPQ